MTSTELEDLLCEEMIADALASCHATPLDASLDMTACLNLVDLHLQLTF